MSLLGFSLQKEILVLDDLFYLYNVNAARLSCLYESSVGAREALKKTEKDINTCFYRLIVATPSDGGKPTKFSVISSKNSASA